MVGIEGAKRTAETVRTPAWLQKPVDEITDIIVNSPYNKLLSGACYGGPLGKFRQETLEPSKAKQYFLEYARFSPGPKPAWPNIPKRALENVEKMLELLDIRENDRVADLGSSFTQLPSLLGEADRRKIRAHFTFVDSNPAIKEAIEHIKERYRTTHTIRTHGSDMMSKEFALPEKQTKILLSHVVGAFIVGSPMEAGRRENLGRLAKALARNLEDGGKIVIRDSELSGSDEEPEEYIKEIMDEFGKEGLQLDHVEQNPESETFLRFTKQERNAGG